MLGKVAIYVRSATENHQDQLDVLIGYCAEHDLEVVGIFLDLGVSGLTALEARPAGQQLLKLAKGREFTILVITSLDRLSRSALYMQQALEYLDSFGVECSTPDGQSSKKVLNVLEFM